MRRSGVNADQPFQNQIVNYPRIQSAQEFLNTSTVFKGLYAVVLSSGLALFNFKKRQAAGEVLIGVGSGLVSLVCNVAVSYAFCLEPPFLALVTIREAWQVPSNFLTLTLGVIASLTLTAQLVHAQSTPWDLLIGLSAFFNYFATRMYGLSRRHQSMKVRLRAVSFMAFLLAPLVMIWFQDMAELFKSKRYSISCIIKNWTSMANMSSSDYANCIFLFFLSLLGSAITLLFYYNAIKPLPNEFMELKNESGSVRAVFTVLFSMGLGFFSMDGFRVSVSNGLQTGGGN